MNTSVEITSEIGGEKVRARIKVTPEQMEKFNQILKENPGIKDMEAVKTAQGIIKI
jgi:hypothetical protein